MPPRFIPLLAAIAVVAAPAPLRAQGAPLPDSALAVSDAFGVGDATLQFRAGTLGTAAPIGIRLVRSTTPRRGAVAAGPLPAMVRAEHVPALAFAAAADSLLARAAGPAAGDSLVATLAGVEGTLRLVRRADDRGRPAYGVLLATAAGLTTTSLDSTGARALVLRVRDLGERLDPDLVPDYARVHERGTQVDKHVVPAPRTCQPQYPERLREAGVEGQVLAQFVVTTVGRAEVESFKALRASHPEFEAVVRARLPCMRFLPAELRGRPVRMLVQQPFTFRIAE